MNILLVNVPFCTPVSPPYSLAYLASFLNTNSDNHHQLLDLNAHLHKETFPELYEEFLLAMKNKDQKSYEQLIRTLKDELLLFSKQENKKLRLNEESTILQQGIAHIQQKKPDVVLLSIVYNSQVFYALRLIEALNKEGIQVIIGGPSVTEELKTKALYLPHEVALLEHLTETKQNMNLLDCSRVIDYSTLNTEDYLIPEMVYPFKTTSCCYYQQCAFCTHHKKGNYLEYDLEDLRTSIQKSNARLVFIIDDMIHKKRFLDIARLMKEENVEWMCQLRPTKEFDKETLQEAYDSGLRIIIWGVESGSNDILNKIRKGTNTDDISQVLKNSFQANIKTCTYILFGFPGETKETFLQTVEFLKEHKNFIDLTSISLFGLQEGSPIYEKPKDYGVTIQNTPRTHLPDKITYTVTTGLQAEEILKLRKNYTKTFHSLDNYPTQMNVYREHHLYWVSKNI